MLGHETLRRKLPIFRFLLLGQRVKFALLVRDLAVGMMLEQTQIAAICQTLCLRRHRRPALPEELEVVHLARAERRGQDVFGLLVSDYLSLLRVALFLAAVTSVLLFWGRSTGHSVASMTTT